MISVAFHAGQLLQPVPGGIGRYEVAMLDRLPDMDVEPIAFAAGPRPNRVAARVQWRDLGWPHGSMRYELWHRLRRPVVPIAADIAHAPSLAIPPVRIPLVVTVHDVAFLRIPNVTTPRGVRFHRRGLELARRYGTLIIAPSHFTERELVLEGFRNDRIAVVPFGIDPPQARDPDELDAALANAGVRRPFVLTVGTVEPRKDLPTIVRAVARLRDRHPSLTLVVVGPRGWGDVAELDRSFVRVLGAQPWSVVDALYRKAEAFCVASLYEGFGLPALEAMARGTPTVATTGSAMDEFVEGAGIMFAPGDVDACSDALGRILDDEALAVELGTAGSERAGELTWERSASEHARAYGRALARSRS